MSLYDFYGNNGYQRMFNNHGLSSLHRGIHTPDEALGIGHAEITRSVPLLVAYEPIMKAPISPPVKTIDDTFVKTEGGGLDMSAFMRTGYYGEPLGGM